MSTTITQQQSFEDRMMERIKSSIGDLITNEDLAKLVKKGIEDSFFKPRIRKSGYSEIETPSLMTEIVTDLLTEQMKLATDQWVKNNSDEVAKVMDDVIKAGVGGALVTAMSSQFSNQLNDFRWNVEQQLSVQ